MNIHFALCAVAFDLTEDAPIDGRKAHIALHVAVDLRQVDRRRARERFGVERGAADDERLGVGGARSEERGVERGEHLDAGRHLAERARDDEVATVRQRASDRLEGATPHDDRVPGRQPLEVLEVLRHMPRQRALTTDDAVARHGDDQRERRQGVGHGPLHTATTDLRGAPPGSPLSVTWPALSRGAGKLTIRVFDTSESWTEMEVVPFSVEIPHEDVAFETASDTIRASEEPKLEAAYQRILAAVREHGADLQAKLYVLGHTDTVGSPSDNQRLSERRALSIARWFRRRGGLSIPVLARGLGETSLAVSTPDNTAEARNRRAQYIVAAQPPIAGAFQSAQ